ncbi:Voltage-gated hydrogen channel 1 [Halotydeus destructor]|nr:Voltage-gated hydrogen channel 1 [Halotydeus destructor]
MLQHVELGNKEPEAVTFREKLQRLFASNKFHIAIIGLVLVDCLIVIGELVLDLRIVKHNCEKHDDPNYGIMASTVLHTISLVILTIFMIEIGFKVFALRKHFFSSKLEVIDGIVVLVSWTLDILSHAHHDVGQHYWTNYIHETLANTSSGPWSRNVHGDSSRT